jgi:Two component regulator propeller.
MFRKLCIIICIFGSVYINGQLSPVFNHLPTDEGLLSNQVRSILKDRRGFLWVGTAFGLNRYDGARFKIYENDPANPHSLMERDIIRLQEDAKGNIWIGGWTNNQVYIHDDDKFYDIAHILNELGFPSGDIKFIHIDKEGNLWVVSDYSLFYYNFYDMHLEEYSLQNKSDIAGMVRDDEDFYVLDNEKHLFRLHITDGGWRQIPLPEKAGYINKIYKDFDGGLWLYSTQNDDVYYKPDTENDWELILLESSQNIQSNFVQSIQMDANGKIWIATDHKGLLNNISNKLIICIII